MAMKAKHAFGMLENVDTAITNKTIDAYDILFVKNAEGKPFVGWVDKNGEKVIVDNSAELIALEKEIDAKVSAEEVEAAIATKVDAATVKNMIAEASAAAIEVVEF